MKAYIERKTYKGGTEIGVYQTKVLHPQAELAAALMEKFGMIAGAPDG